MSAPLQEWGVPAERAELAVLAVHGRGQDPAFMRDTSERFGQAPARFFAPEADGNTWYPLSFLEPAERNEPALGRSLQAMEDALARIARAGFDARRVVLWGFSQGACLLSQLILAAPRRVAGLVLFTGGYIGTEPPTPGERSLHDVPALVRSIEHDPWVPRGRVEATTGLLRGAGADVDSRIDPGEEHIITDEACRSATELFATTAARVSSGDGRG
ncbi:dienelactone hydrolase family protein [Prauserella halophila]|uniref:Dienelactone hydrolase family protein n=1 Tax=Prauserella halophila TaxID=185641 RepID=A0ABN1W0Q1_9PSEU|nr:phospholipase [Prauserella halophila]MCP2237366.1 phospholipase/carboxylesterase [Prauserella halophila]